MYKVLWIFSPVLLSVYSWLFILHCEARGHVMETYLRQMLITSPLAKKEEPTAVWLTRRSWHEIYSKEVHDLRCCVNSAETFDWLHDKEQILIDFSFCVWHLHTSTVDQWTEAMTQRIKAGNVLNYQGRYTIKCFFLHLSCFFCSLTEDSAEPTKSCFIKPICSASSSSWDKRD